MKNVLAVLSLMIAAGTSSVAHAGEVKPSSDQPFGDWILHCTKTTDGEQACALHQRILASDTKLPVAAFALARNKDSHELRLAAILPLGLDIPAGVSGKAGAAPLPFVIQTCVRKGCIASTTVDDKLLEALRGTDAFSVTFKMRIVDEPTTMPVSLKGLDEGLKALESK